VQARPEQCCRAGVQWLAGSAEAGVLQVEQKAGLKRSGIAFESGRLEGAQA